MNILQVLPELNVGGVETGTVDLAGYLVERGHKSVVVSHGGVLVQRLEDQGSVHYTLPVHKKSIFSIFKQVKHLRRIIIDEKIDIVHARSRVPAWIAFFAVRKTQAEFITTCHGYYKSYFSSRVMGWSKLVIVPSQVIGRHMIEDFKVDGQTVRCIARSVDLKRFGYSRAKKKVHGDELVIAIIGRITPLKGHEYFFKSMVKVLREMPKAKIWVVGDAPESKREYRQQLDLLVKRLGIESRVTFLGSRQDVPELLKNIDCVVMASIEPESFGRVIVEAQAAGIPVVATKVGGVVDIIDHGQTGLLVMPKDTEAMANEVLKLLKDGVLSSKLVHQALVKLKEEFTLEKMADAIIRVYEELLTKHHILIIKIGSIGDVVLVMPSIKAIRKKFPNAKLSCLVGKESFEILRDCPYLDEVIVYDSKGDERGMLSLWKLAKRLRRQGIDQVIDFQNNRKSHLLAFLSFPKDSFGYDNGKWGKLLTVGVKNDQKNLPPVAHQFQILKKLGISYHENMMLEIWPSRKDTQYVDKIFEAEWLSNIKHIVGINVAASAKWQTKNWPVEHIARLCDMLANRNIRVVLTGARSDQWRYGKIKSLCKSKPTNLIGKTTVMQLAALIKKCQVYVTPDSAPMHIAAAVGTPCITIFGPTDSGRHVPPAKKLTVLERQLNCAPCYKTRCKILTHACMNDIKPDAVVKAINQFMEVMV